jgi:hypothetical protein
VVGYRIHGLEFGCFGDTCSPENEAAFLGVNFDKIFDENTLSSWDDKKEMELVKNFQRMSWGDLVLLDPTNLDNPVLVGNNPADGYLHMDKIPEYVFEAASMGSVEIRDSYKLADNKVPMICNPRAHLYCDSSLQFGDGQTVQSKCQCHPIYSDRVESTLPGHPPKCLGRAGVPCGYKGTNFTDTGGEELSECTEKTECGEMTIQELEEFRAGKMWQGFGYSPVLVRFILKKATHVCKCISPTREISKMHKCNKVRYK